MTPATHSSREGAKARRGRSQLWGTVPVPYTVSWTAEEGQHLARCPHFKDVALSQRSLPGQGKPVFGTPHSNRQREAIARQLCDTCGLSIVHRTKISLSHARPVPHGADGWAVLQVEPLLHVACAELSIRHCPSLKRDLTAGSLMIRQVFKHRAQCAVMDEVYVASETGGPAVKALGHAKVELIDWADRDLAWLELRAFAPSREPS